MVLPINNTLSLTISFILCIVASSNGEMLCSVCNQSESSSQNDIVVCNGCFHGNFLACIVVQECTKILDYEYFVRVLTNPKFLPNLK